MWRVEFKNKLGLKVFHKGEFHTRKAARLWCKRCTGTDMVLHGPNGEVEPFTEG